MAIKYYYNAEANKDGDRMIAGVPLDDLTEEQFNRYRPGLQETIRQSKLYSTKNPSPTRRKVVDTDVTPVEPDTAPVADAKET